MNVLKILVIFIIIIGFVILQFGFSDDAELHSVNSENDVVQYFNTGFIGVRVLDNLIQVPSNINVYRNGELIQSVYLFDGSREFQNLEYGIYKFVVVDPDYITWNYNAFPVQVGYDNEIGEVELSSQFNVISYVINGDNSSTEGSAFDSSSMWYDKSDTPVGYYLYQRVKLIRGLLGIH